MGQLGVAIFLGISALLGSTSRRPPVPWLVQRLRRLFPAYWLVMIVSFILAWATGYKTFTPGQVVSQMLGLGLLTHPGSLVNVGDVVHHAPPRMLRLPLLRQAREPPAPRPLSS